MAENEVLGLMVLMGVVCVTGDYEEGKEEDSVKLGMS